MFQRDEGAPARATVANVAVASYFYGRPDEPNVEDKLADEEGTFARLVNEMRGGRIPTGAGRDLAALVAQLTIRTRAMRSTVTELGETACRVLGEELTREDQLESTMALVREQMEPLVRLRFDSMPLAERERIIAEVYQEAAPRFRALMQAQVSRVADQVRTVQLKTLKGDSFIGRAQKMEAFTWTIANGADGAFVLGDLGPVGNFDGSSLLTAPIKFSEPDAIFLPISHNRVLVGRPPNRDHPAFDAEGLNRASVELSRDFFVALNGGVREQAYVACLAARAQFTSEEELRAELRKA